MEFSKTTKKHISRATGGREQLQAEGGTEAHLFENQINFKNKEELNYVYRETTDPEEESK